MRRAVHLLLLATVALAPGQALAADLDVAAAQEKAIKDAVARVAPCVVQIETSGGSDLIGTGERGPRIRRGTGPTTGLVVGADGYVISSAFNFANKPTDIFVTVPGKKRYVAKVVANDTSRMLTLLQLLQVEPADLPLPLPEPAPKQGIKIGHTAIALGRTLNPNLDEPPSISVGIISALNRIWGKAIQTDAKVSPANYGGPLVDLQGRVMGILVPASPRAEGETAGVEWYDGGIGFAIPLEDVLAVLPRLKQGKDLQRGVLGITLQTTDIYSTQPVIQTVAPDSPAAQAGIQPGDRIVAIDGHPVVRQAQILHLLGSKYEGDTATVKVARKDGDKDVEHTFTDVRLSAPLANVVAPFLGILPMRDDPEPGVEVRYVYPDSPAEQAGLKPGDRVMKLGSGMMPPRPFSGRDQLAALLTALPAGAEVKLEVARKEGKKTETLTVRLATPPAEVPQRLPAEATHKKALAPRKQAAAPLIPGKPRKPGQPPEKPEKKEERKDDKKKAETGLLKRTNSARDRVYWLYVPQDYDPNISHALLIWLHPIGQGKDRDMEDIQLIWEEYCKANHLILAMPRAENETGWVASEIDFVREMANEILGQYTIDRRRVIAHGMGLGGQLAFYLGFHARDLVRGVATTGAVLATNPKEGSPSQPLSFFIVAGEKDPIAKAIADSKDRLTERKFPVIFREIPEMGHQYLDVRTLDELVRWIDSLDHL